METGASGVNGVHVVRHVNKESVPESENATHLLHGMAGKNAKETQAKVKSATKTFHAQVN